MDTELMERVFRGRYKRGGQPKASPHEAPSQVQPHSLGLALASATTIVVHDDSSLATHLKSLQHMPSPLTSVTIPKPLRRH